MNEQKLMIDPKVQWKRVFWFVGLTFLFSWGICFMSFQEGKKLDPHKPAIKQFTDIITKNPAAVQRFLDVHPEVTEYDLPSENLEAIQHFLETHPEKTEKNLLTGNEAAVQRFLKIHPEVIENNLPGEMSKESGSTALNGIEERVSYFVSQKYILIQIFGAMMIIPGLIAVILRLIFAENLRNTKTFFGKGKNYLVMLGFILVFAVCAILLNSIVYGQKPDWMLQNSSYMTHSIMGKAMSPGIFWIFQVLVVGLIANITFPIIMMWGEEYGWRSYLLKHLLPLGFHKANIITGTIWGLWHAPVILMGYNYGFYTITGVFLFIVYCILLGTIFNYMYIRSRSIVLVSAAHGWHNGILPTVVLLTGFMGAETLVAPIGLLGILLMAVAVWIFAGRTNNFDITRFISSEGEKNETV